MDIGQGAGLAGSSGVRPFLPPLLAGALARGNTGLDFGGTDFSFLESVWWLALLLALAVLSYLLERWRPDVAASRRLELGLGALALAFGALLFAGSLADNGYESWPGLIGGVACAALGFAAVVRTAAPHAPPARPLGRGLPHRLRRHRVAGARRPSRADPAGVVPGARGLCVS